MEPQALLISDNLFEQTHTLSEDILAIELATDANGEPLLDPVSKIPEGAEIECCGPGFNEETLKIRWRGKFYFVFAQDLESQDTVASWACAAGFAAGR